MAPSEPVSRFDDVEDIQTTRTEKLLAVVLTAFLLLFGIWTYTRIDDASGTTSGFRRRPRRTARRSRANQPHACD